MPPRSRDPRPRRKARPARPLTRERVIEAAIQLADADGIERLSMRSLAAGLEVEAMSLYNHVANKDDLLDGMVDGVVAEIALPRTDGDWKFELRRRALSAHEVLMRHPWATLLIVSRVNVGPAMLRHVDATVGCLVSAGFSLPLADHAWNAIDNHVHGFTLYQLSFPFEPDEYADAAREFLPQLPADTYPHLHALSVEVMERRHDGIHDVEFGLDLILDGLERLLRRS